MSEIKSQQDFSLSKASLIVFLFGIGSKGLGFIREIVFAAKFGTGSDFDLYLAASVIPLILSVSFFYISQNFIIPLFKFSKKSSADFEEIKTLNTLTITAAALSIVITLPLLFYSDVLIEWYMGSGFVYDKSLAVQILRIYSLMLIPSVLVSVYSSFLMVNYDFKNSQFTQVIPSITIILASLFFAGSYGVIVIPVSFFAGTLIQLFFLVALIKPSFRLRFAPIRQITDSFGSIFLFTILIEVISQLYAIIDRSFIDKIPSGAISALSYSTNLFTLPITLVTTAITTAILPKVSDDYYDDSRAPLLQTVLSSLKMNNYIILAFTFVFLFYGDTVIKVLFERGQFDSSATSMTYGILIYQSAGLLLYALYSVLNRICYGMGKAKFLFYLTSFAIAVKWLLNFIFVDSLKQNGLALATSLTYSLFFVFTVLYVSRVLKYNFLKPILKDAAVFICFYFTVFLVNSLLFNSANFIPGGPIAALAGFICIAVGMTLWFNISPGDQLIGKLFAALKTKRL